MDPLAEIEPKPSKIPYGFIIAVLVFTLLLSGLPVGVYLVQQRTNFLPKAAVEKNTPTQAGFILKQNKEAKSGQTKVEVLFSSDTEAINLASLKLNFPTEKLEVTSIATVSAGLKNSPIEYEIESSFNNEKGTIALTRGFSNPGIKTEQNKPILIGEILFSSKESGGVEVGIGEDSLLLRNSDNSNIFNQSNSKNLEFELNEVMVLNTEATASSAIDEIKESNTLELISPNGGEAYFYNSEIPIQWAEDGFETISLSLLMNEQFFGKIEEASASSGLFNWRPLSSLPRVYINEENTFKIELLAKEKTGAVLKAKSFGPFEILTQTPPSGLITSALDLGKEQVDFDENSKLDLIDLSKMLSNLFQKEADKKFDLNKDGLLNGIDVWLMQQVLWKEYIIN